MKKIKFSSLSFKEKENAVNEIRFLASIENSNIVSYKDSVFDEKSNTLYIVMEYMEGGDMLHLIKKFKKNGKLLDDKSIYMYMVQLLKGLQILHDLNI